MTRKKKVVDIRGGWKYEKLGDKNEGGRAWMCVEMLRRVGLEMEIGRKE